MDDMTKLYLQRKFSEYYAENDLFIPRNMEKREWAFVAISSLPDFVMQRHMGFESTMELRAQILSNPPAHIYYSSALYNNPNAEKMEDKGWIGAELIFDIDADHISGRGNKLQRAKKEIMKLYDILENRFGVEKMEIVFSGSRGYHIHVLDEGFMKLGSAERREIVEFLTLSDYRITGFDGRLEEVYGCIAEVLRKAVRSGKLEELLRRHGIGGKQKARIIEAFSDEGVFYRIRNGDFAFLGKGKRVENFVNFLIKACARKISVEVDAPVTGDIKRLIRLPNSLHGKTGFVAKLLSYDELESFDPFSDALAFGEEEVKVMVKRKEKFKMNGEVYELLPGNAKLPECAAIFLMCRGAAIYGH
jgi:DNA primase small subunit